MKPIIFLGPSLPLEEAPKFLDAIFRPPCKMGDVLAAAEETPPAIGIIDGYFECTPAVWHKEVLYAISRGIEVFGGASMGALRAAELQAFGMRGVGDIFAAYANGELEDDDEVAVAHLPPEDGYRCQSDAMVNIRFGLDRASKEGIISEQTHAQLLRMAKQTFYPQRSWHSLLEAAAALDVDAQQTRALARFIERCRPDKKRDDAIALLRAISDWLMENRNQTARKPPQPSFDFEPTVFWEHLRAYFGVVATGSAATVHRERVLNHVRLLDPQRKQLRERALLLFLVEQEAKRLAMQPPDARSSLERFRRERQLHTPADLSAWLTAQRTTNKECVELARLEATLQSVQQRYCERIDAYLPAVLKAQGSYGEVVEKVRFKWESLAAIGLSQPSEEDVDSLSAIIDWYQSAYGPIHTSLAQHSAELGFGSPRQLLSELIAQYLIYGTKCAGNSRDNALEAARVM